MVRKQRYFLCDAIITLICINMINDEDLDIKLRIENSINSSGIVTNIQSILILQNKHYIVLPDVLDGDAPKQFIKAYIYNKGNNFFKSNKQSWPRYIAKTAEKWYPVESIIEFLINKIGCTLNLNINKVELVNANKQIRFLSKYFLNANEKLIHGAEICGEHLGDLEFAKQIAENKNTARDLFTFEFIKEAIENVFPHCYKSILIDLVKLITFDAIVGNNDRHFYNWGVIGNTKKRNNIMKLSPIYDTARGLTWNLSDAKIIEWGKLDKSNKKFENYILNAEPRISIEENKEASHFDLLRYLNKINPEYATIIKNLSSVNNEIKVLNLITKDFKPFFTFERYQMIINIIIVRFTKIREEIVC